MAGKRPRPHPVKTSPAAAWDLHLFVAGSTPKSLRAIDNLTRLCESKLKGQYRITIVDLLEQPELASANQIVAIPTLVRKLPLPVRKILGDLSAPEQVIFALEVQPHYGDLAHGAAGGAT